MLMHYPQLQIQDHTLASESINSLFLLEKEISSTVMLLHQLIPFQQSKTELKMQHRWQREPNPVIGFTLSHNLRSVHF